MNNKYIFLFIIALLFVLPTASFAVDACVQGWETGPSISIPRYRMQGTVVDGVFYVFGGGNGDFVHWPTVEAYNYWGNSWTARTDMPTTAQNYCVAAWNDIIYIVGGNYINSVDELCAYDHMTDTWDTSLSKLPVATSGASCAAWDGKIFVAGGYDVPDLLDVMSIYDIATDTWTSGSALPAVVGYGHGAIIDDDFVVAGGWVNQAETYIYDIGSNSWSTGNSMIYGRQSGAIANAHTPNGEDFLFILGGGDAWTATNNLQQYYNGNWFNSITDTMPVDRVGQAGGAIGGAVMFSAGGASAFQAPESDFYIFNLCGCHIQRTYPSFAPAEVATTISFIGIHFDDLTDFWLKDEFKTTYALTDVSITSSTTANAKIPTSAPVGVYELWADNSQSGLQFRGMIGFELCACVIDSACYAESDVNPANDCQVCNSTVSTSAWSDNDGETCDDGLWCTENDQCASGVCAGDAKDCNDGEFCTGTETCNEDTDACDSPGDPCDADEVCNEDTDACDTAGDDDATDDDATTDDDTNEDDDTNDNAGDDDDDSDDNCCG